MENRLEYLILSIVSEIPEGKVASYSQIAALAGYLKNARKVGKILSQANLYGEFPCHRVVHQDGSLVEGWQEQKRLLQEEGVVFQKDKVDMKKSRWET